MAIRPAALPRWATIQYGGYGVDWDKALIQTKRILFGWAALGEPRQYEALSEAVTAVPWPDGPYTNSGQQIGMLLGQVSMAELDLYEDRPLISALVYGIEEGMPSYGFWDLLAKLNVTVGVSQDQRLKFWLKELGRCFDTYGSAKLSPNPVPLRR